MSLHIFHLPIEFTGFPKDAAIGGQGPRPSIGSGGIDRSQHPLAVPDEDSQVEAESNGGSASAIYNVYHVYVDIYYILYVSICVC